MWAQGGTQPSQVGVRHSWRVFLGPLSRQPRGLGWSLGLVWLLFLNGSKAHNVHVVRRGRSSRDTWACLSGPLRHQLSVLKFRDKGGSPCCPLGTVGEAGEWPVVTWSLDLVRADECPMSAAWGAPGHSTCLPQTHLPRPAGGAALQGQGSSGSWAAYSAKVWCRN